jgi:hypothetical protein
VISGFQVFVAEKLTEIGVQVQKLLSDRKKILSGNEEED